MRKADKCGRGEDGRLIYCGRKGGMFKVSGIWVTPFEVERTLVARPSVIAAAVVAV